MSTLMPNDTLVRPRVKHGFHVEIVPPAQVFLVSESRSVALEGRVYVHLCGLLTGEYTTDEIVEKLEDVVPAPEVYFALGRLANRGCLTEGERRLDGPRAAFWDLQGLDAADAEDRLAQATVSLKAVGPHAHAACAALGRALEGLGVRIDDTAAALVVVTDDYLQPALADINREALVSGRRWLLVKPVGMVAWIGPLFGPEGPCWQCLAQRIQGNRHVEFYLQRRSQTTAPVPTSVASLPSTELAVAGLTAVTVARWLASGTSPALEGGLITLDLATSQTQTHHVVRRPQCPSCGSEEWQRPREPRPLVLQSRPKRYDEDGGYRTKTPEEVYEALAHHVSPISGVVSTLEQLSGGSGSLAHSYAAGHNFAMMTDTLFFLRQNLRGRSGGKGVTEMQAKVGGICEAIERYSGVYRAEEFEIRSTLRALGERGLDPSSCMLFSERQYAAREAWNEGQPHTRFHLVPEPFDPNREVSWTPAWSLTHNRVRYVPAAYCYYGHPDLKSHFFCLSDANGSAAGNAIEEAILQGFFEVAERDAVALWWYNRIPRPAVDLDSFDVPYFRALTTYYHSIGREIWVLDITSDLGIPTFVGVSRRIDRPPVEDIIIGFGAHLDPKLAILRALTEVNQFLPAVTRLNPDGSTQYWFHDTDAIEWWRTATTVNRPYIAPAPNLAPRRADQYPPLAVDDIKEDVDRCVAIVAKQGLETLVVDQTRPDVGLSVVKVIVPGLRHFWRRLAPGRLYDVPVRMGWLDHPPTESDMNPVSIFF
jgi:ribosomal protein S12 methylthiotransferase accessory factor